MIGMRAARSLATVAGALLLASRAAPASAKEALPVYVSFEFRTMLVANLYTNEERVETTSRVADAIAARCAGDAPPPARRDALGPWRFQRAEPGKLPRIDVWLEEDGEYVLKAMLIVGNGPGISLFRQTVFKQGEIYAYTPSEKGWPSKVIAAFEEALSARAEEVRALLRAKVPIGKSAAPLNEFPSTAEEARAVLPLDFDRYRSFSTSWFAILARVEGGRDAYAWIHSIGTGKPTPFPGGAFSGITVQYDQWEHPRHAKPVDVAEALEPLGRAKPQLVYLEREDPDAGVLDLP